MDLIEIERINKSYGPTQVLRSVNWKVRAGEQWVIRGASGSGKSTLIHIMAGLDTADSGIIKVDGKNLALLSDQELANYRNQKVGVVFQFHYLLPSLTGLENVFLPARLGQRDIEKLRPRTVELAKKLGITHCLPKYPFQMSGGEQQRVNVLRAISLSPQLLLCDEPTGNLDSQNSHMVIGLIRDLAVESGATLIVVTHDPAMASQFQNQAQMKDGMLLV